MADIWDVDDEMLAELEAREDAELGWDVYNDDTFGDEMEEWDCEETHVHSEHDSSEEIRCAEEKSDVSTPPWFSLVKSSKFLPTRSTQRKWYEHERHSRLEADVEFLELQHAVCEPRMICIKNRHTKVRCDRVCRKLQINPSQKIFQTNISVRRLRRFCRTSAPFSIATGVRHLLTCEFSDIIGDDMKQRREEVERYSCSLPQLSTLTSPVIRVSSVLQNLRSPAHGVTSKVNTT